MDGWDEIVTDWVNLPPGSSTQSLWTCLHDAELTSVESDPLAQTVLLEVKAFFMPEEIRVILRLDEVRSVRVNKYPPPFESLLTDETPWEERMRVAGEWVSKWREESMGWQDFESALSTDPLEIKEADLAAGREGIALRIGGHLNGEKYDDLWCSVFLRAGAITASRSDGQDFSMGQFINLGEQWWESFGSRTE